MSGKCAEGRRPRAMHLTQKHPDPNPTQRAVCYLNRPLSSEI